MAISQTSRADTIVIDLTRWTPPDISTVGDDPFGKLVKYGHRLFTNAANEIGPVVPDPPKRLAGNNLACGNCHLQAGTQPFAMPLIGVSGQFPQYRAREGTVVTLEERINGCMQRSMHGRALSLDSPEMKAFSAYMRWLSEGVRAALSSSAQALYRSRSQRALQIPAAVQKSMRKFARHATEPTDWDSAHKKGSAISFRRSGVRTVTTMERE